MKARVGHYGLGLLVLLVLTLPFAFRGWVVKTPREVVRSGPADQLIIMSPHLEAVRRKFDERWRQTIKAIVLAGQEAGEFTPIDADDFAITLSALLDGMAVQIALEDPDVPPSRAYDLAMRYAAGQLGFEWKPASASRRRSQRRR